MDHFESTIKLADRSLITTVGLVAGKVHQNQGSEIRRLIESQGWVFWSPSGVANKLRSLANQGNENDPAKITAKILMRRERRGASRRCQSGKRWGNTGG